MAFPTWSYTESVKCCNMNRRSEFALVGFLGNSFCLIFYRGSMARIPRVLLASDRFDQRFPVDVTKDIGERVQGDNFSPQQSYQVDFGISFFCT